MLILAAILDLVLVLVFWTKMLVSFSHILVISILESFSLVLVDENAKGFSPVLVNEKPLHFSQVLVINFCQKKVSMHS